MAQQTAVTSEAIAALINMGKELEGLTEGIHQETERLKNAFAENEDGLGAHSSSIQALIDDIEETERAAERPVKILVLKLNKAAIIRQGIIEKDNYSSMNGRTR